MFDFITLTSWSKGEKVGLVFPFLFFFRKKNSRFFSPKFFEIFQLKKNWGETFDNGFVIKY
jgi:hypothetical protein